MRPPESQRPTTATDVLVAVWGVVYAIWALAKHVDLTPASSPASYATLCSPHWVVQLSPLVSVWECLVGMGVVHERTRRVAALLAVVTNGVLFHFAVFAHFVGIPYEGCDCFFGGIELPWLPGHALLAAVLLLPFLAIFLREERRFRRRMAKAPGA